MKTDDQKMFGARISTAAINKIQMMARVRNTSAADLLNTLIMECPVSTEESAVIKALEQIDKKISTLRASNKKGAK